MTNTVRSAERSVRPIRRWAAVLLVGLVVGGGALAGCTDSAQRNMAAAADSAEVAGNNSSESTAAAGGTTAAGPAATQAAGTQAGDPAAPSPGPSNTGRQQPASQAPTATDNRQIIRTGSFTVAVSVPATEKHQADQVALRAKVSAAAVQARAAGTGVGGYVSASENEGTTESITLRVPVSRYEDARRALGRIGELTGSESSQDVTGELADMDGRIDTMKAAVSRLRQLVAKAGKISDIIAIESELSGREADLEAIIRKRAAMADQVTLSTLTLVISGSVIAADASQQASLLPIAHLGSAGPTGFVGGMLGTLAFFGEIGAALAVVAGVSLPLLPFLLVLMLAIRWLRPRVEELRRAHSKAGSR